MARGYRKLSLALGMVLVMTSLAGCRVSSQSAEEPAVSFDIDLEGFGTVTAGETIAPDSKWINSEIDGAIEESTETNEKDDFYTAVNKEWILSAELGDEQSVDDFSHNKDVVDERKMSIINGESAPEPAGAAPAGITDEMNLHNEELVADYAALVSDWDARNELGSEPARKYIEAIEDIRTTQDLEEYLIDADGVNFTGIEPVGYYVGAPMGEKTVNTVIFDGRFSFLFSSLDSYSDITPDDLSINYILREAVGDLLQDLGYTKDEVDWQFSQCYKFEFAAAKAVGDLPQDYETYEEEADKEDKTLEEVEALAGNYPIRAVLTANGLGSAEKYRVYFPEVLTGIGALYTEENLPQIRAYYLIHTAAQLLPYLDRDSFDAYVDALYYSNGKASARSSDLTDEQVLLEYYFGQYFPGAMEEVYVARYCTEEQKQDLIAMTQQYIDKWEQIIMSEDWLSEETRAAAVDKLRAVTVRCLYPDTFTDYTGLDLSPMQNCADAANEVSQYLKQLNFADVNTEIDRTRWDESRIGTTTTVNAVYSPEDNSVTIYAGLIASNEFYAPDASLESNLGQIGMIIGHEISHAFDSSGSMYDKNGNSDSWWSLEDVDAFQVKVDKLSSYYNTLTYYRGGVSVLGTFVAGEAMADMGGMKASLLIAKDHDNFDYDTFFRSYAKLWRGKRTKEYMDMLINDVHPANFIRTNVTLTEFDEFYETYGISEGDGMYRAPEQRVAVW